MRLFAAAAAPGMMAVSLVLLLSPFLAVLALGAPVQIPVRGVSGATYTPFVPGGNPRCFSDAELKSLGITPLPDGARASYGLSKLILERNPWSGAFVSAALAAVLIEEALNIPVDTQDSALIDTSVYARLADGVADVNMEIWEPSGDPSPFLSSALTTTTPPDQGLIGVPELGTNGQDGLFFPDFMLEGPDWENFFPETYRGWHNPQLLARLLKPTDVPEELWLGSGKAYVPPWCALELDPPGCPINSDAFADGLCRVVQWEPSCAAVIAQNKEFDPMLPALISAYKFNMTVIYFGDSEPYLRNLTAHNDALAAAGQPHLRTPYLAMSWLPYGLTEQIKLSRVAFPPQGGANCRLFPADDFYGTTGDVFCDFTLAPVMKGLGFRLALPAYSNVLSLLQGLSYKTVDQSNLIADIVTGQSTWPAIVWDKACTFLKANPTRWQGLIENSLPPAPPQPPRTETPSPALTGAVRAVSALVLALTLCLHCLLQKYRSRPEIKGSSVAYCHVMVTGPVLASIGLLLIPELSSPGGAGVCQALPPLFSIGFNLIFGSAFLKTFRIYKIFSLRSMQVQRLSRTLLGSSLIINGWDVIVLIVWMAADTYTRQLQVPNSSLPYVSAWTCRSDKTTLWVLLLVLPKAGLLLSSIYLAWSVRAVASNFNESRFLGFALYSTFFAVIFLGPFAWLSGEDPQMLLVMAVLLVLLVYAIPILIIFLPKLLSIWLWNKDGAKQALGVDLPRGAVEGSSTTGSGGNSTGGRSGLRSPTNAGKVTGGAPNLATGSNGIVRSAGTPNSAAVGRAGSKGSKASNNVAGGDKYVYSAAPGSAAHGPVQSFQEKELSSLSQASNTVRPLPPAGNSARKIPRPSLQISHSRGRSTDAAIGEHTVAARPTVVQLSVRSFGPHGQSNSPKVAPSSPQTLPGQSPIEDDEEEMMLGAAAGVAVSEESQQRTAHAWPSSPSGVASVGAAAARGRTSISSTPATGALGSARGEPTIALTSSHSASSAYPAAAPTAADHLIAAERGTAQPQQPGPGQGQGQQAHGLPRSPHPMATTQQHAPLLVAESHRRQRSTSVTLLPPPPQQQQP